MIALALKFDELRAALALDQHTHCAIRQFQQLNDTRHDTEVVEIVTVGIVLGRVELRDEENFLVGRHRGFERGHRFVATDEQRDDHLREDDDVAKRQYGEGFVHGQHMGAAAHGRNGWMARNG